MSIMSRPRKASRAGDCGRVSGPGAEEARAAASETARIAYSRHETAALCGAGIWFENILNQALLRKIMHRDPTSRSTHYKLTELGDETVDCVISAMRLSTSSAFMPPRLAVFS